MRIFAAASTSAGGGGYDRVLETVRYPFVLIAFPYDRDASYVGNPVGHDGGIDYIPQAVITDSGAFSVWKSGHRIDLGEYVDYCQRIDGRPDLAECDVLHVSLDVMPGRFGEHPTTRQRTAGMKQSLKNGDRLRAAGLRIMEVYHQYEPLTFLDELLDRRQPGDVVGISPRQPGTKVTRRRFCDGVLHHILERHGKTNLPPLHGLGVGGRELVWRYPWYSVDAISWIAPGTFGRTMTRHGVTRRAQTRNRAIRHHECAEFLRTWERWNATLTEKWAKRGVRWAK